MIKLILFTLGTVVYMVIFCPELVSTHNPFLPVYSHIPKPVSIHVYLIQAIKWWPASLSALPK